MESKECIDDYNDDDDDEQPTGQSESNNNSEIYSSSQRNLKKPNIEGYFGSVLEIFGLNEEINTVGGEFHKLKEMNKKTENASSKAGKRRAPSG